mgnify:CR=1 FL=1
MKNKILSNKIKIISIISITLLLFVTIPGKASNKKEVSYREYFVLKGDTVWSIASKFKTEKMDIRDYGSGNAGTTNAFRVMGAKAGFIVFLGGFPAEDRKSVV